MNSEVYAINKIISPYYEDNSRDNSAQAVRSTLKEKPEVEFKTEIGNAVEKLENAEQAFIDAIKKGDEKEMMLARIQYDKASRIFSAINEFLKNKATILMNIIHSMRLS